MKILFLLSIFIGIPLLYKMYKTFTSLDKNSKKEVKDKIKEDFFDILGD